MSKSWPPELVKVTTCGKRVFVDIIKLRILKRLGWALKPMTIVFIRDRRRDTDMEKKRQRHREEGHVQTEAETGVDLTSNRGSATECQQPPEARRKAWEILPQSLQKDPILPTP